MAITEFESLPYDVLFEVVHLLSVADILRLRQISQKFRRLTYEKTVWDNAYRKSSILRPPGPFPSQSAAHIEHELKKCTKLHANWTSKNPRPVSRHTLDLGDNAQPYKMTLALGRYLLVLGDQSLRCYDLDSSGEEWRRSRLIASYDLSIFDVNFNDYDTPIVDKSMDEHEHADDSQLSIVCALPCSTEKKPIIVLLDLHISHDDAGFELRSTVFVPKIRFFESGPLIGNFLVVNRASNPTVLHIPTNQIYYLPSCDLSSQRLSCILTSTHLLVHGHWALEAFILPDGVPEPAETSTQQSAVLTRSHMIFPSLIIGPNVILSSHTTYAHSSPSSEDQHARRDLSGGRSSPSTTSITILAQVTSPGGPLETGFVDIVLNSPADGEGEMTVRFTLGLDDRTSLRSLYAGIVQRGCARIIGSTRLRTVVFSVNVGEGGRSIWVRELDMEKGIGAWEWDGLRGRLCRFVSETCIEIRDYV